MAKSSIKKNFLYQMIYELLVIILPFVTSPYIARVIGAEGLGTYSYTYSVAYYFVLFSMLGLKNYGNRSIARIRENQEFLNQTFTEIYVLHFLTSAVCVLIYIIYCIQLKEDRLFAWIQFAFVLSGLFDISWFFFGIEKFKLTVTRNIIIKILNVVCVFMFVKQAADLWKYCLIMSLGMLISQLMLWFSVRKYVHFTKIEWSSMKKHVKPMLILFIPAISVSLYKYMDKIMIRLLSSKEQLGFYENAEKVNTIPLTIISSFGTVMLPKMSNLEAKKDKEKKLYYMRISMKYVMCLAFAMAFGMAAVGKTFASMFWGKDFAASGQLIMGLSVTVPFISFANVIRTQYLIPNQEDKKYTISVVIGAVVNLVINFLLIPIWQSFGATIGTIAAEITVCMFQTISVRKELPILKYVKDLAAYLPIGIIMFIPTYLISTYAPATIKTFGIELIVGATIYCIFIVVYFYLIKDDILFRYLNKIKAFVSRK